MDADIGVLWRRVVYLETCEHASRDAFHSCTWSGHLKTKREHWKIGQSADSLAMVLVVCFAASGLPYFKVK